MVPLAVAYSRDDRATATSSIASGEVERVEQAPDEADVLVRQEHLSSLNVLEQVGAVNV